MKDENKSGVETIIEMILFLGSLGVVLFFFCKLILYSFLKAFH